VHGAYLCDTWQMQPLGKRTAAAANNQELISEHVELERKSSNGNQHGLHFFADCLHAELDRLAGYAVEAAAQLARTGNEWVRFKSALGSLMKSLGQWLSQDFHDARERRDARTSRAFTRLRQSVRGLTPGGARGRQHHDVYALTLKVPGLLYQISQQTLPESRVTLPGPPIYNAITDYEQVSSQQDKTLNWR
jgi:hypothetical protein